jgi:hypothetical protein
MAIVPFRARRQSLTPEQHRGAALYSAYPAIGFPCSPTIEVVALESSKPAVYSYHCQQGGTRLLEGAVALIDSGSLKQLRCIMRADPADLAFARESGSSNQEQLAPVLALYNGPEIPFVQTKSKDAVADNEVRIEPINGSKAVRELQAAVSGSLLTVIAGQEWIEAFPARPCMALLVNLRTCAPQIEALHRTVRWKPGWHAGDLVRLGREHFFFQDITRTMPPMRETGPHYSKARASECLRPKEAGENVYLAVTAQHTFRVHSLPGWADTVLAQRSPEERAVTAVQLHDVLMAKGLQMLPESGDNDQISYTADPDEAVARVMRGEADVAFLMNAPTIEQIVAVARTGGSIPPQSFRVQLAPVPGAITYAY